MLDGSPTPRRENVTAEPGYIRIGNQQGFYLSYGKRAVDILFVLLSLPLLLPVVVLIAICVMCDGGAPFFGHKRVGRNGKSFRCWKIRTMVPNAEERLEAHLASDSNARREWNEKFKLENDPRVTRIGGFLRKTSLDEFPQIWNILVGEMSVVGPRPVTAKELTRYGTAQRCYCSVRPGLTGPWQVSGRNNLDYDERISLDVDYVGRSSFPLDVSIILRTVKAVIMRTGQ